MIIANPIYNTVFYHFMHDLQIAKDFLSSILDKKIFNPNNQIEVDGVLVDEEISLSSKLVKCLSRDLIVIQIPFIPEEPKTKLEIILSIFEQRFLQKDHWYKEYKHHIENNPVLLAMLNKLEIIAHDEKVAISLRQEEVNELMYQNMLADARAKEEVIVDQGNLITQNIKEEKRKAEEERMRAEKAEKELEKMRAELAKINNK